MQMPAAGHRVRKRRAAHEGCMVAVTAADLFDRVTEQHHVIRRAHALGGAKYELDLAGPELELDRGQVEAKCEYLTAQNIGDRLDAVETQLREMVVAVVNQLDLGRRARLAAVLEREPRVQQARNVELDLETRDKPEPVHGQPIQHTTQQIPG